MIPVAPVQAPADFDEQVRQPGIEWLAAHPNAARPYPFWTQCLPALAQAFSNRCAYAAMLDPTGGTVDHYRSFKGHRELAYEWSNYRFASQVMNSSKQNADDDVLDPHEIGEGWFEILLPSLQMRVTDAVPEEHRERANYTLQRLKLRDGERLIRWRLSWYQAYQNGGLTLEQLRQWAPLIAEAIVRTDKG
jgi:hypothetical protein